MLDRMEVPGAHPSRLRPVALCVLLALPGAASGGASLSEEASRALAGMDFATLRQVLKRSGSPKEWLEACDAMAATFEVACRRVNEGSWQVRFAGMNGKIERASAQGLSYSEKGLSVVIPWRSMPPDRRQSFLAGAASNANAWLARVAYAYWSGLWGLAEQELQAAAREGFKLPSWLEDAVIEGASERRAPRSREGAGKDGAGDGSSTQGARARPRGSNWPRFRGPSGDGVTTERALPTTWGEGKNIIWKTRLPKAHNPYSSPVVWEDRLFLTSCTCEPLEHHVLCFDANSGKLLWDTAVEPGPLKLTDLRGGYGAPTPCTDGERVYVAFGSAVVAGLDFQGRLLWRKELQKRAFDVAMGSSPFVFGDTVILLCDQHNNRSTLLAFDARTGELRWEEPRPGIAFGHSTPCMAFVNGRPMMLVAANGAFQGLDPANGKEIWRARLSGDTASPAFCPELNIAYADGGRGGDGCAVDVTGTGEVSSTHVRWTLGGLQEGLGSPVIAGGYLYRYHNGDVLKCVDLRTGKLVYAEKLPGASAWASPVATADGLVYFVTGGKSYVVRAGPKFEIVGGGDLHDPNHASPAVSGGRLFVRGTNFLYCIGAEAASTAPAPRRAKTGPKGEWVVISEGLLNRLAAEGKQPAWPGKTTGVVVDRTTGELFLCIPGLGLWKSTDSGETYERYDHGAVSGRAETGWTFNADPEGGRLACFMLDGTSAWTLDGGRTWQPFAGMGRGWDFGAVDWTSPVPKTVFAFRHESGGEFYLSTDGARSWKMVGKDLKVSGLGVVGPDVLLLARGNGIERSTDGGASWQKVSDVNPKGRVPVVFRGVVYWTTDRGMLASRDKGKTWQIVGSPVNAIMGPFFGRTDKHMVVVGPQGFSESTDGGATWRLAAPLPPIKEIDWFGNFAWDPIGDTFYAARMGQPAYKYER